MKKLTPKQVAGMKKLFARPDSEIDLSDIPEITKLPEDYSIGTYYRAKKTSLTLRLDADVVAWFRSTGEGYQTRINAHLRQLMRQQIAK
jgi:uncharacterized protein (DUF4415 family)